jgi:hypothetical protein
LIIGKSILYFPVFVLLAIAFIASIFIVCTNLSFYYF